MKKVLVVNGEKYWPDILSGCEVVRKPIQSSVWALQQGRLTVADHEGSIQPDGILWRVGAIRPSQSQINALNLIALSGIPCVNPAQTLRLGYDRLSMLGELQRSGLPLIDFDVVSQPHLLKHLRRPFPFVIKVGNYHGGYGKTLVRDEAQWQDLQDLLFVTSDYITVEPFIDYVRDIRYIAIGKRVWAMSRKGKFWKANVQTTDYQQIEPEAELQEGILALRRSLGADILALDILEERNGRLHVVEYNDIPGLSGFSDELKYELAEVLLAKMGAGDSSPR